MSLITSGSSDLLWRSNLTDGPRWYLHQIAWTRSLSDFETSTLGQALQIRKYSRGAHIYVPGGSGRELYLLLDGVAKLVSGTGADDPPILAFLHQGDLFGEQALGTDNRRDHFATAHDDALVGAWEWERLCRIVRDAPRVAALITRQLGHSLRMLRLRVEHLQVSSALARVVRALLDLGRRCGVSDASGILIPFRVTQSELASFSGLTRETVNVSLKSLRQAGLVELRPRSLRLIDPKALAELPGDSPGPSLRR
jgi:CRP/FNR family transcriptional regulator, cyclic AMP receptor protein